MAYQSRVEGECNHGYLQDDPPPYDQLPSSHSTNQDKPKCSYQYTAQVHHSSADPPEPKLERRHLTPDEKKRLVNYFTQLGLLANDISEQTLTKSNSTRYQKRKGAKAYNRSQSDGYKLLYKHENVSKKIREEKEKADCSSTDTKARSNGSESKY